MTKFSIFKYASAYTYMQVSPVEIRCIVNVFAVKYLYLTKEEWNKVAISLPSAYISYQLNRIHFVLFIPSDALRVKPNTKYLTDFLSVLKNGLKRNKNSHDIMSLSWSPDLINLWWSLL